MLLSYIFLKTFLVTKVSIEIVFIYEDMQNSLSVETILLLDVKDKMGRGPSQFLPIKKNSMEFLINSDDNTMSFIAIEMRSPRPLAHIALSTLVT